MVKGGWYNGAWVAESFCRSWLSTRILDLLLWKFIFRTSGWCKWRQQHSGRRRIQPRLFICSWEVLELELSLNLSRRLMSLLARVDALESQSGKMGDGLMQLTVYTWSMRTKQQLNLCGPGIVMGRVEFAEATKFECSAIDARRRRTKVEILRTLHTWYRKLSYEREAKSIE